MEPRRQATKPSRVIHDEKTTVTKDLIAGINQWFQGEGVKYRVMAYWSRNAVGFSLPNPEHPEKLKQASESKKTLLCYS